MKSRKLSISHGLPFVDERAIPTTLAECLVRAAHTSCGKGITYVQHDGHETFQSYSELLEEAGRVLAGLRRLGLKSGDKVLLQITVDREFLSVFWGCVLGGFVPVPLSVPSMASDPESAMKRLYEPWLTLSRPVIIADESTASTIRAHAERFADSCLRLHTATKLKTNRCACDYHAGRSEDLAILLLTSGSTGQSKAVMQTQRALLARSCASAQMNGFTTDEISLNWLPIEHVGGLIRFHLGAVYLGCQQVQIATHFVLADPLRWLDMIDRHRATVTWAPNFAYGLVNAAAEHMANRQWDLSSMAFILNGGEAIVRRTARRFVCLLGRFGLPETAMHPAWGMSETSSAVTYSDKFSMTSASDDDPFVEVGKPIPGVSLRIVDEHNQVVEEETIGSLQVRGVPVTEGYYDQAQLTRQSFTSDGWFISGDRGFLRNGRLTITGRDQDLLIINGVNYHSHIIEAAIEESAAVAQSFTAACPLRLPGADTDQLVLFFCPLSSDERDFVELLKSIRATVVRQVGINPEYLVPIEKTDLPKTSIGKIQRAQLSHRFLAGEFTAAVERSQRLLRTDIVPILPRTALEDEIAAIWAEVLGCSAVEVNRPFWELGGDSVSAIRIVARVLRNYRSELLPQVLYRCATVAQMAHVIASSERFESGEIELERLLTEIEKMTDDEALQVFRAIAD